MNIIEQRKMVCPVCGSIMTTVKRYDVEIDICDNCHGVWLDRGELNKIINEVSDIYKNVNEVYVNEVNTKNIVLNIPDDKLDVDYLKKLFE